mgnify:FL=1
MIESLSENSIKKITKAVYRGDFQELESIFGEMVKKIKKQ